MIGDMERGSKKQSLKDEDIEKSSNSLPVKDKYKFKAIRIHKLDASDAPTDAPTDALSINALAEAPSGDAPAEATSNAAPVHAPSIDAPVDTPIDAYADAPPLRENLTTVPEFQRADTEKLIGKHQEKRVKWREEECPYFMATDNEESDDISSQEDDEGKTSSDEDKTSSSGDSSDSGNEEEDYDEEEGSPNEDEAEDATDEDGNGSDDGGWEEDSHSMSASDADN